MDKLFLIFIVLFLFSCEKKLNSSTIETLKSSFEELSKPLTEKEKKQLKKDMLYIINYNGLDLSTVDHLNIDEVTQKAKALRSQEAEENIKTLKNKIAQLENKQKEYSVEIASFQKLIKNIQLQKNSKGVYFIHTKLKNEYSNIIRDINIHYEIIDKKDSSLIVKSSLYTYEMEILPNAFLEWKSEAVDLDKIPKSYNVNNIIIESRITSFRTKENEIFPKTRFSDNDAEELNELKRQLNDL